MMDKQRLPLWFYAILGLMVATIPIMLIGEFAFGIPEQCFMGSPSGGFTFDQKEIQRQRAINKEYLKDCPSWFWGPFQKP